MLADWQERRAVEISSLPREVARRRLCRIGGWQLSFGLLANGKRIADREQEI